VQVPDDVGRLLLCRPRLQAIGGDWDGRSRRETVVDMGFVGLDLIALLLFLHQLAALLVEFRSFLLEISADGCMMPLDI
jgi:hypothetical protein